MDVLRPPGLRTTRSRRRRCWPACRRRRRPTTRSTTRAPRCARRNRCSRRWRSTATSPRRARRGRGQAARRRAQQLLQGLPRQLLHRLRPPGAASTSYGESVLAAGDLKVYTTINPHLGALAKQAINGVLDLPGDPSAALVSENPNNGYVDTMAQSGSYAQSQYNLATQAQRQPGSTFKAIVLADALAHGIDPFTTTTSRTRSRRAGCRASRPTRSSIDGGGSLNAPLNLDQALVASDNTVFAQLAADLGEQSVTQMAYAMGVAAGDAAQLSGRGARRPDGRRDAARDGERLRDDRRRRLAQQADHDHEGRLPRRPRRPQLGRAAPHQGALDRRRRRSRPRSSSTTSSTARRRGRRSAARPPPRPARPAASSTPGSTASRPTARRSSGWATRGEHLDDRRPRPGAVRRRCCRRRSGTTS